MQNKDVNDWVMLTSSTDEILINILKNKLESEGIHAVVHNKKDSAYGTFGSLEIHVDRSEYIRAKNIIDEPEAGKEI